MTRNSLQSLLCVALVIVLVTVNLSGCAGTMGTSGSRLDDKTKTALICGAGGAAGGAGRHGSLTGALVGAAIGALAGALVAGTTCFAIAEYRSRQVKTYD